MPCNQLNDNWFQGIPENSRVKNGSKFSFGDALFQALEEISKEKKMYLALPKIYTDYYPPKLHKVKSGWYISYYVKNPETGRFKLFRIKLSRFRNQAERGVAAKEIMAAIQEKLSLGWNPLLEKTAPMATTPAFEVFDRYERVKSKEMENQSMATYKSYIQIFREWLVSVGFRKDTSIFSIDEKVARKYMAFLEEERGVSPRTYNNYLSFQVTFFDWMKDKGYVKENPFCSIRRKPKRLMRKKRRMLTDEEISILYSWLSTNNPEYLAVCQLCYCCFMRPKEIALLRCGDIDLERQIVHVRADVAKNDNESFRTIPDAMMPVMRKLNLQRPEWFLFGKHNGNVCDFRPAVKPTDKKRFSDYWARVVRPACGFGQDVQFYSQKDTGITNMLDGGVAINLVQQQADHSSVAMTAIYVGKKKSADAVLKKVDILHGTGGE